MDNFHFLNVSIMVPVKSVGTFTKAVQAFLDSGGFMPYGWKLAAAYCTREPFQYSQQTITDLAAGSDIQFRLTEAVAANDTFHTFTNIWQYPNDNTHISLGDVMLASADNNYYTAVDDDVASERQNFVMLLDGPGALLPNPRGAAGDTYLRLTRWVKGHQLAAYSFNTGALVPYMQGQYGWRFVGTFQNVTGHLNTFQHVFKVGDPDQLPSIKADMEKNPLFQQIQDTIIAETYDIFTIAGYWPTQPDAVVGGASKGA